MFFHLLIHVEANRDISMHNKVAYATRTIQHPYNFGSPGFFFTLHLSCTLALVLRVWG